MHLSTCRVAFGFTFYSLTLTACVVIIQYAEIVIILEGVEAEKRERTSRALLLGVKTRKGAKYKQESKYIHKKGANSKSKRENWTTFQYLLPAN